MILLLLPQNYLLQFLLILFSMGFPRDCENFAEGQFPALFLTWPTPRSALYLEHQGGCAGPRTREEDPDPIERSLVRRNTHETPINSNIQDKKKTFLKSSFLSVSGFIGCKSSPMSRNVHSLVRHQMQNKAK